MDLSRSEWTCLVSKIFGKKCQDDFRPVSTKPSSHFASLKRLSARNFNIIRRHFTRYSKIHSLNTVLPPRAMSLPVDRTTRLLYPQRKPPWASYPEDRSCWNGLEHLVFHCNIIFCLRETTSPFFCYWWNADRGHERIFRNDMTPCMYPIRLRDGCARVV